MSTVKKIWNISLKVITWLLVAVAVFMMIFTIVSVATVDQNQRSIFGHRFYIVKSDSMSLSDKNADLEDHFNAGDIVIIKNLDDAEKKSLKPGDIIAFMSTNEDNYGETVTHMIRSVNTNEEGKIEYETYGTNKGVSDKEPVEPSYVLGLYKGKLPMVGRFFAFVKSTPGYITCILIPFALLILYNVINIIRLSRKYKREQDAAVQAERDQIEAERAENQRMMQELLALKAQLEAQGAVGTPPAEPKPDTDVEKVTEETTETQSEAVSTSETDEI